MLTKEQKDDIVVSHNVYHYPISHIAKKHNITRPTVYKVLKEHTYVPPPQQAPENKYDIQNDINLNLDQNTGNTLALYGAGKAGKTTALMHIYRKNYMNDPEFICSLFSVNSHISAYKVDKKLLKCGGFNAKGEKFIKLEKYINSKCKNKYKFANFWDDVIDMKYSKLINQMILTYRNSNISTFICMQYAYLLNKMSRANLNGVLIFNTNSNESKIDLIKTFLKPYFNRLGIIGEPEMINFFDYITKDHGFFYIDNLKNKISFHRLKI